MYLRDPPATTYLLLISFKETRYKDRSFQKVLSPYTYSIYIKEHQKLQVI